MEISMELLIVITGILTDSVFSPLVSTEEGDDGLTRKTFCID